MVDRRKQTTPRSWQHLTSASACEVLEMPRRQKLHAGANHDNFWPSWAVTTISVGNKICSNTTAEASRDDENSQRTAIQSIFLMAQWTPSLPISGAFVILSVPGVGICQGWGCPGVGHLSILLEAVKVVSFQRFSKNIFLFRYLYKEYF